MVLQPIRVHNGVEWRYVGDPRVKGIQDEVTTGRLSEASLSGTFATKQELAETVGGEPAEHDHPATGISDSTELGRTLLTAVDAAGGRDALGITVDNTVGERVFVGSRMVFGDTGWRDVRSLVTAATLTDVGVPVPAARMRRVGATVYATIRLRPVDALHGTSRTAAGQHVMESIPSGFRQSPTLYGSFGLGFSGRSTSTPLGVGGIYNFNNISGPSYLTVQGTEGNWASNDIVTASLAWFTNEAWPTSLPGSPA